ncbi:hypothetical protein M758_12G108600 [Ceratodon purpureus]|nr:hypothetical protein M758_12G108600 [Ceratodon purpureus]
MAEQKKIYDPRENGPPRNQPPSFELPNQKIEVEVQLGKLINSVLPCLQNDLQQHNMDNVSPDPAKNRVTVSGYPPVNGFDEHTVLAIVKRRDPQATLLASRFL